MKWVMIFLMLLVAACGDEAGGYVDGSDTVYDGTDDTSGGDGEAVPGDTDDSESDSWGDHGSDGDDTGGLDTGGGSDTGDVLDDIDSADSGGDTGSDTGGDTEWTHDTGTGQDTGTVGDTGHDTDSEEDTATDAPDTETATTTDTGTGTEVDDTDTDTGVDTDTGDPPIECLGDAFEWTLYGVKRCFYSVGSYGGCAYRCELLGLEFDPDGAEAIKSGTNESGGLCAALAANFGFSAPFVYSDIDPSYGCVYYEYGSVNRVIWGGGYQPDTYRASSQMFCPCR